MDENVGKITCGPNVTEKDWLTPLFFKFVEKMRESCFFTLFSSFYSIVGEN